MNKDELKQFLLEYALIALKAECKSFSTFYNTDLFSVEYEIVDNVGIAYLIEPEGKSELARITFEDIPLVLGQPLLYTDKPFMRLAHQYKLTPPSSEN